MADQERERLLAAFADHLLKNRLADEKHGRYMVGWVRHYSCRTEQTYLDWARRFYTHVAKGLRSPPKSPLDLLG